MRLWLREEERRPTPPTFASNDATALLVGCVVWALALVAVLVATTSGVVVEPLLFSTVVIGLVLGTIGLFSSRHRS
ncbi:DUF2530 domain-containing protein [Rathayibacter iranicus]|uniref:DUF2530 domain-containing protein n=2 Tax=Rathayibacter iranicus TaxID=59737 RepID=A0AAD1EMV7_9MICO|nr:DUF2530 domain-containing protein [Rathayibacter iranicus]AZZ55904.1 DUF2530 domain-containing protein [Rathayibacter iranicus]MWV30649.1 DUF2530 domain-containing protein [Rathayibacter iranicus NCPPB 2253 = VKM Ac-1602]PPI47228.1 DUF2530 domain-containing protein [Rathayibacter iranicus]PPI60271.1 DUF2530 domain-containing protein [Rathayibacter iranicus]PPI71735.1 DUF2530 domain-containing protein [Rathayibacter iranicus]